ncbi:methylamine dehydrogenase accessory protein MauD [Pseudohongiella spirulinae]|uniref:Methylamine utilization protein MauD n=1 Tax=Pseudohongiella spirulinae TaxID=1249552 RepID=A0A0S2KE73_9GAMM|nr:methylamine dehydrogenase accessory protein MauD [Pseudohongiella spirulinae]ALO46372.1 Thiol-disulfide isomerase and thioredoxin [Pseudohongiella spirulinae]
MSNALAAVLVLLTLVVLVLVFAVIALARQIGILHTRLAPAGALMTTSGPKLGEKISNMSIPDIHGKPVEIGATGGNALAGKAQLLLFVSPSCPICKELVPTAKSMARSENVSLIFGSDGGQADQHLAYIDKMDLKKYPYIVSLELGMRFEVAKLPYAVLIDDQGVLRSKGLVNSREHLESLVHAMQSGYESIQDYMVKNGHLEEQA